MTTSLPIDDETRALLREYGFDQETFDMLRARLRAGEAGPERNRITGQVEPPAHGDVRPLPPLGGDAREMLAERGRGALARGEVGVVVLAGGMATRFGGVVKAGVEVLRGKSFLELKVDDVHAAASATGGRIAMYPMTSFATDGQVRRLCAPLDTESCPIRPFAQFVSLRLTPEGELFFDDDENPSPYAPGHGDLPFALRRSGILRDFRARGGKLLYMSNVDNATATLDPAVIGAHLESGASISAEVAPKEPGDKGGAPARVDGRAQIIESFRFPRDFDQDRIPVFNTNSFVLDAEALDQDFELSWFAVHKQVHGRDAVQFERLVGELTAFLPTHFVRVERYGPDARFQPAKDPDELGRRRPEIEEALSARGIL
jgi:UTP--glucose-1-phosphate uridylyltransferase